MNPSQITDERFYTPRATVSTARSTNSFYSPRSEQFSARSVSSAFGVSSGSESDYPTQNYRHYPPPPMNSRLQSIPSSTSWNFQRPVGPSSIHRSGVWNQSEIPLHVDTRMEEGVHHRDNNLWEKNDAAAPQQFLPPQKHDTIERRTSLPSHHGQVPYASEEVSRKDIQDIFSFTRHGRVDKVDSLLQRGVNVDTRDENGNTILAVACQNGSKRLVKVALRYGAQINACNFKGNTALHFCYRYGYADTLGEYLIGKGADVEIRNGDGCTPQDLAGA